MHEQDKELTPQYEMSEYEQEELLEKRKNAILNLVETMLKGAPLPVQTMYQMNRSMVHHLLDSMTFEQSEEILNQAESIIEEIRG